MFQLTLTCNGPEAVGRGCTKALVVGDMNYHHEVAIEARRLADDAGWHTIRLDQGGTIHLCPTCWVDWTEHAKRAARSPLTPREITTMSTKPDSVDVRAWLRDWAADPDNNSTARAAIQLLDWHGHWLNSRAFLDSCVHASPEDEWAYVNWREARDAHDAGTFTPASTTELAILDFAIALGEDRYRLNLMGDKHATALVTALAAALNATPYANTDLKDLP